MKMDLPEVIVRAGAVTKLSFRLAQPAKITTFDWSDGFELEELSIGPKKFDKDGLEIVPFVVATEETPAAVNTETGQVTEGAVKRLSFHEHRFLPTDDVQLTIKNASNDDRNFSGKFEYVSAPLAPPAPPRGMPAPPQPVMGHAVVQQRRGLGRASAAPTEAPPEEQHGEVPLGNNEVRIICGRFQAERLRKLAKGEYVSPEQRIDLVYPLDRALR